jgi:hypothetical protein
VTKKGMQAIKLHFNAYKLDTKNVRKKISMKILSSRAITLSNIDHEVKY